MQSSSATLPNLSRPPLWLSHPAGAHERQAFDHCCGRVAELALERLRVQRRCPRAPTPEPGKGRRPKNRQSQWRKVFLPGCSLFFPVLACMCRGFPGSGSLVLRPCPFGFLFLFVPPGVSFYWPRASCSSSQREGRRANCRGTDPRTGSFQVSLSVCRPGVGTLLSTLFLLWATLALSSL